MMIKMAIKNAKRTFGDYLIYILTVSLSIAFIYAINGLVFQPEIQKMSRVSSGYLSLMLGASGVVVFVVAGLVKHMTKYIFDRRSKEFGIYSLMGIESKDISKMYNLEQIILGVLSTIIGLVFGRLILEIVKAIVFRFLDIDYQLTFFTSFKSIFTTIILIVAIYFFALLFNSKYFKKRQIIDWINSDKINETTPFKSKIHRIIIFFISIIVMAVSILFIYYKLKEGTNISLVVVAFIFLGISIYGITYSIPTMLVKWALRRNREYTEAVISVRFFNSKINEMAKKLGTLTILLIVSLSLFLVGMIFSNFYILQRTERNNYDFLLRENDSQYVKGIDEVVKKYGIKQKASLSIFEDTKASLHQLFTDTNLVAHDIKMDTIMPLSNYNALRRLTGNEEVTIPKEGFILQINSTSYDVLAQLVPKTSYIVMGKEHHLTEICKDPMSTYDINYTNYYIVINDEELKEFKPDSQVYLWNLENDDFTSLHDDLLEFAIQKDKGTRVVLYNGKDEIDLNHNFSIMGILMEENKVSIVVIILSLVYMAMIFCFILATVLAVSMVSDASKYKYRYDMLNKMGIDLIDIKKLIAKQICLVFGFPLVIAIPVTIAVVYSVSQVFTGYILKGFQIHSIITTAIMFFVIYGIYMLATYVTYKNTVIKNN